MKVKASFRGIEIETGVEPLNSGCFILDFDGEYLMEIFYDGKEFAPTGRITDGWGNSGAPFIDSEVKIERIDQ
jgi:hypothetical protein